MAVRKKQSKKSVYGIISLIVFAIIGIASFIIGYALRDGWTAVLAWFTSRWAIYVYIAIAFLAIIVAYVWHKSKMEE